MACRPDQTAAGPFFRPHGWYATERDVRVIETMLDVVRLRQNEGVWAMFDGDPRPVPRADSVADKERYLTLPRSQMEKPFVVDPPLKTLVDTVYRDGSTIGSGSSAAAVREENIFGHQVKGRWHTEKAIGMIKAFEKWISTHATAAPGDRAAAENILRDMKDAVAAQ